MWHIADWTQNQRPLLLFMPLCVSSRIDYCNAVLVGSQKVTTDRLQVINAAARVVSGMRKYDRGLSAHWAALARCTRASQVQAQRHGAQLSERPSTPIPDRLLHPILCSHTSAASQIRQLLDVPRYRLTGFLCGRPDGLEIIARVCERPGRRQRQFQETVKNVSVCSILMHTVR